MVGHIGTKEFTLRSGEYRDAIRLLNQALSIDSFIDKIHYYLGMAYLKNNQEKEACEQFKLSEQAGDNMSTADLMKLCR